MSRQRVEWFKFTCDQCGKTGVDPHYPAGWRQKQIHDCGLTGYTTEIDVCADCIRSEELKQAHAARKPFDFANCKEVSPAEIVRREVEAQFSWDKDDDEDGVPK